MTTNEIREWYSNESLRKSKPHAAQLIDILLAHVEELENKLAGRTNYHSYEAVERRVKQLEAALREIAKETYTLCQYNKEYPTKGAKIAAAALKGGE